VHDCRSVQHDPHRPASGLCGQKLLRTDQRVQSLDLPVVPSAQLRVAIFRVLTKDNPAYQDKRD